MLVHRFSHLCALFLLLGMASVATAQVPGMFHFSGQLDTANGEFDGNAAIQIALYDHATLGGSTHELWVENQSVTVNQGRFHVMLGAEPLNPVQASVWQNPAVYIGITVGNNAEMTPRIRVGTTPYASLAGDAATLGGISASSYVTQTQLGNAGYSTGSHTTYSAGTGVTLTGTTFSADTSFVQKRVSSTCTAGSYIRAIAADGTVTCETDANTPLSSSQVLTMVSDGGFLSSENDPQVGPLSMNYVPRWDGNALQNSNIYAASNGKIGIGTAPSNSLDVDNGDVSINGAAGHGIRLYNKDNTSHRIYYSGATNSVHIDSYSQIHFNQGFYTPGNVGIGITAPVNRLDIEGGDLSVHGAGGHSIRLFNKDDTNHRIYYSGATNSVHIDSYSQIYFNQGFYTPGNVGIGTPSPASRLHVAGGCISGYFCSDARLKTHIRPLDESVLDRITQLEASTYQWKHSPDGGTHIGLIAQQVESVFPEIVSTGDNGEQKGLSCTGLNAVLVEAVKEQQQQIDELQTRLNAIEKRYP